MEELRLWVPTVIALLSLLLTGYRFFSDKSRETYRDLKDDRDRLRREAAEKDHQIEDLQARLKAAQGETFTQRDEIARLRERLIAALDQPGRPGSGGWGPRRPEGAGEGGAV